MKKALSKSKTDWNQIYEDITYSYYMYQKILREPVTMETPAMKIIHFYKMVDKDPEYKKTK